MSSEMNRRTMATTALLLGLLALGMGTCGTDSAPTSSTDVGQVDQGFVAPTTSTAPADTPTAPTPPVCGPSGECVCEEGYEPDEDGNCVVIVVVPPPPDPGSPTPSPGPGGPGPTTTTIPAATTWGDVQAVLASDCSSGGCHPPGPINMGQWQAAAPSVIAGVPGHSGGAVPASVSNIFAAWSAGGFQP